MIVDGLDSGGATPGQMTWLEDRIALRR